MKVNPLIEAAKFLNQVHERRDGQGGRQQQGQSQKDEKAAQPDVEEVSDEKLNAAIQAFALDGQTQAAGLSAAAVGKGPGLRVVLKDVNGAIIRQFTGEEFLKLRQGVSKDVRSRGKILDQKL